MSFPSKSLHRMKHFVSYWNKTYQSVTALICIYSNFVAQRQVGETALNDKSSRSHQIVRLVLHSSYCICSCLDSLQPLLSNIFHHLSLLKQTIESRIKEKSGRVKSFVASLVHSTSFLLCLTVAGKKYLLKQLDFFRISSTLLGVSVPLKPKVSVCD